MKKKDKESSRILASEDDKVENWAEKTDSDAYEAAAKLYQKIQQCYDNQQERMDNISEYWNIYNAIPDENQQYTGNSTCYIPEVRNCINARTKRTLKSLFPVSHKHVEVVGEGDTPYPVMALLEHYIRKCKLRNTIRQDLLAGDVTGQWNLYVDWTKTYRNITKVVKRPQVLSIDEGLELDNPNEENEELETEEVIDEHPDIVPFAAEDLAVYPPTVNDIEDSIASSIRLRMSKDQVQKMIDEGVFIGVDADELVDRLAAPDKAREKKTPPKQRTNDAGIRTNGTYKYALIYEVATNLKFDDKKEPAYVYFCGPEEILGIIRNPFWSGKRPVISAPTEEMTGSFFGISKIDPVKYLQWNLNDYWNMGQDSAQYSLLPIVMTDPLKSPNYQSMVMGLAAVWLTDPNSTKAMTFPQLYKEAIPLCENIKSQIRESMDVNDAMMGKSPQGRKNAQQMAAMQQDQQININDHAERYEDMMLNPLLERIFELDQQFRTKDLTVVTKGEIGVKAKMMKVEPQQFGERYFFRWCGTDYQMGMQRMQQMIAWMNVLRGIPPQQMAGRRLDITPIIEHGTEQIFGPEISPHILIDERNLYTVSADDENIMMHNGIPAEIHPSDNDQEHIQTHNQAATFTGDPSGLFRAHIAKHAMALNAKRQQQMAQQQQGAQGVPGGAGPGVPGTPRMGAVPGQPRPQQPPGAIHQDQIIDAGVGGRG